MDRYIHILKEVEDSIWMYIVLKKTSSQQYSYKVQHGEEIYMSEEVNVYVDQ